jgi:hypothetical protein
MPFTDWTQEILKGTFSNLLRRVDRSLKKLLQRAAMKVYLKTKINFFLILRNFC